MSDKPVNVLYTPRRDAGRGLIALVLITSLLLALGMVYVKRNAGKPWEIRHAEKA